MSNFNQALPSEDAGAARFAALNTWLNGLVCVAPFTLADARELYDGVKAVLGPGVVVDVNVIGNEVRVQVDRIRRVLAIR